MLKLFLFVYDKSREKNQDLYDLYLIFFYTNTSHYIVDLFINMWFRNATQNPRDVHRCQINVQLHHS